MYIKLDYFNFSAFDLKVKATKILKYIKPFIVVQRDHGWVTNYQVSEKY